jgi:hypothetical protein
MTCGHVPVSAAVTVDAAAIAATEVKMLSNILRFILASSGIVPEFRRKRTDHWGFRHTLTQSAATVVAVYTQSQLGAGQEATEWETDHKVT